MAEARDRSQSKSPSASRTEEELSSNCSLQNTKFEYEWLVRTLSLHNVPYSWEKRQVEEYIKKYTDGRSENTSLSETDREEIWVKRLVYLRKGKIKGLKKVFQTGEIAESIQDIALEKNEEDRIISLCLVTFTRIEIARAARYLLHYIKESFDPPIIANFYRPVLNENEKTAATRSRSRSPIASLNQNVDKKEDYYRVLLMTNLPTKWNKSHVEEFINQYTYLRKEIMDNVRCIYLLRGRRKMFTGKCVVRFGCPYICEEAKTILNKAPEIEGEKVLVDFDYDNRSCIWKEDLTPDLDAMRLKTMLELDQQQYPVEQANLKPVRKKKPKSARQKNPEPVQQINPEPVQRTNPEPVQQTNPEPVQQTIPELVQQINPEQVQQTNPEPVQQTIPELVQQINPEQVQQTNPDPIQQMNPESVQQINSKPVQQTNPEPVQQMNLEPVLQTIPELVQQMNPEPVQQTIPELVQQMNPELVQQMNLEPVLQTIPELVQQMNPEPVQQTIPELVQQMNREPVQQTNPEPVQQMNPEPVQQMNPEPVQQTIPELVQQMNPEPVQQTNPGPVQQTNPELVQQMNPEPVRQSAPIKIPHEIVPISISCNNNDRPNDNNFIGNEGHNFSPGEIFKDDAVILVHQKQETHETFGLRPQFLACLGIKLPLKTTIFVANLAMEYDDERKIRKLFGRAGKVLSVIIIVRHATLKLKVEYDHPVEAVQAIAMFHNQEVYGKRLFVQMARSPSSTNKVLPEGLKAIGPGLGPQRLPLKDIRSTIERYNVRKIVNETLEIKHEDISQVNENICKNMDEGNDGYSINKNQCLMLQNRPDTGIGQQLNPNPVTIQNPIAIQNPVGIENPVPIQNQIAALASNLSNPIQNNPLLGALGALLNPQAAQLLQLLILQNPSVVLNPAQSQGPQASSSGSNVQVTDVLQNLLSQYNLNMQNGANIQGGINVQVGSNGPERPNIQGRPSVQGGPDMHGSPNMQSELNVINMQGSSNAQRGSNIQTGPNAVNLGGMNTQRKPNMQNNEVLNMHGKPNTHDGLNEPVGPYKQGGPNVQGGHKMHGELNMHSGPNMQGRLNIPVGLNMHDGPNMPVGLNMHGGPNMPVGLNMHGGPNMPVGLNKHGGPNMPVGLNMHGGPNMPVGLNMHGGPNMPVGLNAHGRPDKQGDPSMQGGLHMHSSLHMQGGPKIPGSPYMPLGPNMHVSPHMQISSNIPGGPHMQEGPNILGIPNIPARPNMQGGLFIQERPEIPGEPNISGPSNMSRQKKSHNYIKNDRDDCKRRRISDDASCSVMFNYLPPSVTLKALTSKMYEIGDIKLVEMIEPGRAVVVFTNPSDAAACIELLDRTKVDGQTIDVRYL